MKLLEVHGVKKTLDTNLLPEKQKTIPQIINNINNIKPRLGQGRARIKCKKSQPMKNITTVMSKSCNILRY